MLSTRLAAPGSIPWAPRGETSRRPQNRLYAALHVVAAARSPETGQCDAGHAHAKRRVSFVRLGFGAPCTARVAPGAVVIDTRNIVDREAVTGSQLVCLGNGTVGGY
jgi:hypothetical protein